MAEAKKKADKEAVNVELKPEIAFEDFDKIDLRVGTIMKAEKHPNADNLLIFKVRVGTEERQVISGVAGHYKPEEMLGKKVILVANLKPRQLRGEESNGMLLFARDGKALKVVTTDAADGSTVN